MQREPIRKFSLCCIKGISMLELMIAILLIGIIVATGVPIFVDLSNDARRKVELATVASVRSGIYSYYLESKMSNRAPSYPAVLDNAADGPATVSNAFFANVVSNSVASDWTKAGVAYAGPTKTIYTYNPARGTFESGLGLVASWNMGEVGAGGTVQSIVGGVDSTGQIVGSNYTVDPTVLGGALTFKTDPATGLGTYLQVPDSAALNLTTAGTVGAWVNMSSIPSNAGIIHKGDNADFSDEQYSLQFDYSNRPLLFVNPSGTSNFYEGKYIISSVGISTGGWHYVVSTWDASGMNIYIDGQLTGHNNVVAVAQSSNTSGHLNIGAQISENYGSGYKNFPLAGSIAKPQVYDRALSANEIKAYYNSTKQ